MMGDEQTESAAKDVFVLLDVDVPEILDVDNKWQDQNNSKISDNDSMFTLDSDDKLLVEKVPCPLIVDVTPPEELDYSSSDSMTKSELEEKRWYNPNSNTGLEKSDFDSLKEILKTISDTDLEKTLTALIKIRSEKTEDLSFQNMFIAQNGFQALINLLDCNNKTCMLEALVIINEMSKSYGVQCNLCDLDVVKPLLNILLFEDNPKIKYLVMDTLHKISRLRKGRKLIRLSGGIDIMVTLLEASKSAISRPKQISDRIHLNEIKFVISCAGTLRSLCRSMKSQNDLWYSGFIPQLPQLLDAKDIDIQITVMSLVTECLRPNATNQENIKHYFGCLKDLNVLQQIIPFMISSSKELAGKAIETILGFFDGSDYVYKGLLKYKGLKVIFKAIEKFWSEKEVLVLITNLLWKTSCDESCRNIMEKQGVVRVLLELLTDDSDLMIGYAVATLSEMWLCESSQPELKQNAIPKYLEFLTSNLNSLVLCHVCNALARASKRPDCMEMINEANGFRLVFTLLPTLDVDEFDKYGDFYEQDTIISVIDCLIEFIKNTPSDQNNLKGMYEALYDLVNLLKHTNPDILSAVCRLIEMVACHEENLNIMVDLEIVKNLVNLMTTTHTNLRANLCRALGKCCAEGGIECKVICGNLMDQLLTYVNSDSQIIRDSVPLVLRGLSKDPLNCIKIDSMGFIPFVRRSINSNNKETVNAAIDCLQNIRHVDLSFGHRHEEKSCKTLKMAASKKPTTIKEALAKWQENNKESLEKAKYVGLQFQWLPIAKMDNSLSVLKSCEKLSLTTNKIEKISGLAGLKNLKILALGRNNIHSLVGLEPLADTLEQLWISYNSIEKMKGILNMHKIKVLYMAHNRIDSWDEVQKLAALESLTELDLVGNPLYKDEPAWRIECAKRLPKLSILNGVPIIRE